MIFKFLDNRLIKFISINNYPPHMKINKQLMDMRSALRSLDSLGDKERKHGEKILSRARYLPLFIIENQMNAYLGRTVIEYLNTLKEPKSMIPLIDKYLTTKWRVA